MLAEKASYLTQLLRQEFQSTILIMKPRRCGKAKVKVSIPNVLTALHKHLNLWVNLRALKMAITSDLLLLYLRLLRICCGILKVWGTHSTIYVEQRNTVVRQMSSFNISNEASRCHRSHLCQPFDRVSESIIHVTMRLGGLNCSTNPQYSQPITMSYLKPKSKSLGLLSLGLGLSMNLLIVGILLLRNLVEFANLFYFLGAA